MSRDTKQVFQELKEVRTYWKAINRPNEELPGFDFDCATNALAQTEALEFLRGKQLEDYAQALLDPLKPPVLDLDNPPYSALVIHFHLSTAVKAVRSLAGADPEQLTIDAREHDKDLAQIRNYIEEMNRAIPMLEKQVEQMGTSIQEMNDRTMESSNQAQGIDGVQLSFFGVSASIGSIKSNLSAASRALSFPEDPGMISIVESKLRSVLSWAQNAYDRVMKTGGSSSNLQLAVSVGQFGKKAALALAVAKNIIVKTLKRKSELSERKYSGWFTDGEYAIAYEMTGETLKYIDHCLEVSQSSEFEYSRFVERYINPVRGPGFHNPLIQDVIFRSFEVKRMTETLIPVYIRHGEEVDEVRCKKIVQAVSILRNRMEDENYIGPITPLEAVAYLGFPINPSAFGDL